MISTRDACDGVIVRSARFRAYLALAVATVFLASFVDVRAALAGNLDRVVQFDIPAQRLDKALLEFGAQAHVQIMFAWNSELARMHTEELKGNFSARKALAELLRGTPLQFVEHGGTVRVLPKDGTRARDPTSSTEAADPQIGAASARDPTGPMNQRTKAHPAHVRERTGQELQTITVTGTHIAGAPLSSPVLTITSQEISRSGYASIGDLIRSLPENFGGGNNPQVMTGAAPGSDNISFSGGSAPNLLGLGSASTLTLVNGHRLAADSPTGAVDISLIPLAVIDHIDVLTDGASAIYGSDAVAGVVNLVLRKDFNGSKTTLLGGGTTDGGATERKFNEILGTTWSSGGVIFDYEFDKLSPIYSTQREYSQSAASPTTLLPGSSRNSFFVSAHQMLSEDISSFVDGLYTYRIARDAISNFVPPVVYQSRTEAGVHQYAAAAGLKAALPSAWQLSVVGSSSEQRTLYQSTERPGGPYPAIVLEGQTKYAEATANGPILRLPSGIVRAAVGGGYRLETYAEEIGGHPELSGTQRNVKYVYGETSVPLLPSGEGPWRQGLVLDASARYVRYSDVGSESVPKIGLIYEPFRAVKFRSSWGRAFQAPPLFDVYSANGLLYIPLADPRSGTRVSDALVVTGGDRELRPETATTWTVGMDYDSETVNGLRTSLTYFNVIYRDRISRVSNFFTALTDPLNSSFVIRAPSSALVQGLIGQAGSDIVNDTRSPLEPGRVPVLVNDTYVNVASQNIDGLDFNIRYRASLRFADVEPFLNCALLDLRQRIVPQAPEVEISGQVFEPPKLRARGGAALVHGPWSLTGTINYSGSESNIYQPTEPQVASWTTFDFDVALRPQSRSELSGLALNLSIENAFNRDPPFVQFDQYVPGLYYDSLNASVLGRVIRLSASWAFQ